MYKNKRKNCSGCEDNQPNQEAHYGGCLKDPNEIDNGNKKRNLSEVQGMKYGSKDYPAKKNKF